ncbi:MAG: glutathione S-transferase N-terminal domain-containing protein [Myxococcales bacterium]|nr:glutathione S-transferase N-terminal domain-containing protein [Myxococcales bacterium]
MQIVLYAAPMTSATPVVHALAELEVPHEIKWVEMGSSALRAPEFLALNPNGKVPTLVVDDTPMFEALAIMQWLGDRFGVERGLWPAAAEPARREALAWSTWAYVTYGACLQRLNYASSERMPAELHSAALAQYTAKELQGLLGVLDGLKTGGGTDLHGGLVAGYALAEQVYDPDRINRIVLVSDGGANAGITDIELIADYAGTADEDGIYMVGVGVGDAVTYHDDLMDAVTDAGKGASVFIGDAEEAQAIFGDGFISTMDVAARDVQVRLDLPPGFEIVRTSAEEVSADPSDVEPQHLAPNDAMVFHQQIRTCAPELVTDDTPLMVTVHYLDAHTFEPREVQHVATFAELLAADPAPLLKGAAVFAYSESLKAYKKADLDGRGATTAGALAALEKAEQALPGDADLAEIREVLEALAQ